jgi:hypothetical protein
LVLLAPVGIVEPVADGADRIAHCDLLGRPGKRDEVQHLSSDLQGTAPAALGPATIPEVRDYYVIANIPSLLRNYGAVKPRPTCGLFLTQHLVLIRPHSCQSPISGVEAAAQGQNLNKS